MKNIILVRHAKSSWSNMALADHDRPLNERGKHNAPEMGKRLNKKRIQPDLLLSSTAKRARATAKKIAKEIDYPKEKIQTTKMLFHADGGNIIEVIKSLDDSLNTVMIFGHNPGFTTCSNALTGGAISNIPTCGVASIELHVQSWSETSPGLGMLLFFDYPKNTER